MASIFGNLGVHVIQFPSGRFGFVGTLPVSLGAPATSAADAMAGRKVKFPVFETKQAALDHATERGVAVQA
jgi:hypothetical protein